MPNEYDLLYELVRNDAYIKLCTTHFGETVEPANPKMIIRKLGVGYKFEMLYIRIFIDGPNVEITGSIPIENVDVVTTSS